MLTRPRGFGIQGPGSGAEAIVAPPGADGAATSSKGIPLSRLLAGVASAITQAFASGVWTLVEVMDTKTRNGHVYLELAERGPAGQVVAKANAMIWANRAARLMPEFERATGATVAAGIKLLVRAKPTFKPQFGFSLEIEAIDPDYTLGDLEARKKEVRARLQAEGVFDRNRELPAPWDFNLVLVAAPHEAAGLGDFRSESDRLAEAGICRFVFVHSRFQGEGAPREILAALRAGLAGLDAAGTWPDALVIIRGGGAVNDLSWLNDYGLARFICDQGVPVLTGIGHERDSTLLDEVAHKSFHTPSKVIAGIENRIAQRAARAREAWAAIADAAARAVRNARAGAEQANAQVAASAQASIAQARQDTRQAMNAIGVQAIQDVHAAARGALGLLNAVREDAAGQLAHARQAVPQRMAEIRARAAATVGEARSAAGLARTVVVERAAAVARQAAAKVDAQMSAVGERAAGAVDRARSDTEGLMREIAGQGPSKTLARGFAIVRAGDGAPVTGARDAENRSLEIQFRDGKVDAQAGAARPEPAAPARDDS